MELTKGALLFAPLKVVSTVGARTQSGRIFLGSPKVQAIEKAVFGGLLTMDVYVGRQKDESRISAENV